MSLIAIAMNLLLVGLLAATLGLGIRLNRRLKALRDSHAGFEEAVRELNLAAARAEQGLADLRSATDEATDLLSDRIEKGRALAARLERLVSAAPEAPAPRSAPRAAAYSDDGAEQRLGALLAAAREARARPETLVRPETRLAPEPPVRRMQSRLASLDDDLFEDAPLALDRHAGARL